LEDCSVFGNFVITLIGCIAAFEYPFGMFKPFLFWMHELITCQLNHTKFAIRF
jgi:hypothetical protein